ncbi:MarR family transcriptional regulator [Halobacterium sp. KA-6]|uniref:MarR family transcriptional regulator n=1 Tax=Halobacterium sp. KA-6 TaxID=2896368 RepID=UPI001E3F0749|nr:helix-turn-helix domain-containing protein [Halobacterium sp. KA-6]MCD2205296.1 MarR family transcriptional regulator [Halobacterium sp. KA-6]
MGQRYNGYANRVPTEVKIAIEGMDSKNELTYAVVMSLIENGDMQFTQLEEELGVHSQSLSNALKSLETGGWVRKKVTDAFGDEETGYYTVTNFGHNLLDALYEATKPKYKTDEQNQEFVMSDRWKGGYVQNVQVKTIENKETVATESFEPNQPLQARDKRFA